VKFSQDHFDSFSFCLCEKITYPRLKSKKLTNLRSGRMVSSSKQHNNRYLPRPPTMSSASDAAKYLEKVKTKFEENHLDPFIHRVLEMDEISQALLVEDWNKHNPTMVIGEPKKRKSPNSSLGECCYVSSRGMRAKCTKYVSKNCPDHKYCSQHKGGKTTSANRGPSKLVTNGQCTHTMEKDGVTVQCEKAIWDEDSFKMHCFMHSKSGREKLRKSKTPTPSPAPPATEDSGSESDNESDDEEPITRTPARPAAPAAESEAEDSGSDDSEEDVEEEEAPSTPKKASPVRSPPSTRSSGQKARKSGAVLTIENARPSDYLKEFKVVKEGGKWIHNFLNVKFVLADKEGNGLAGFLKNGKMESPSNFTPAMINYLKSHGYAL
jgi:hypothetical protein